MQNFYDLIQGMRLNAESKQKYLLVVQLWHDLKNQHKIAQKLGLHQSSVSKILCRCGIRVGRGRCDDKIRHLLPMQEVVDAYESGESTISLGRRFGVDPEVIRRRMRRYKPDIQMRPVGGRDLKGPKNPQWKGGIAEQHEDREPHRLARRVAEFCLGRRLKPVEIVHHHDENPLNNHPCNLWVFPSTSAHIRYHQQQLKLRCASCAAESIHLVTGNGGQALPVPSDLTPLSLDKDQLSPYKKRVILENHLKECGTIQGRLVRPREHRR